MFAKLHSCLATPPEVTADRRACCHGPLGWETGTARAREVVAQRACWVTLTDRHRNEVGGQSPRERRGGKAAAGTWSGSVRTSGDPARRSHPRPARFSQGMTPSKVPAPTFSADPADLFIRESTCM
ncbi:pyridoxal phosphate phosphatase PHOSPHO2 isoform X3 [Mustela erminea]|uniref:pyridoxal phosphate phosphatase PHOSPHO2 isoform X3 n=1 Tax=Mustela erminea TaxID=36723 RepID=UPI001386B096|nr:pyridoxal phosphate phosphatase PHOSPHO2 isoform X3 [Mustela erminea]